ncbi:MAG: SGNH/GDSL hydrolase family protein [Dehalococcoidia bacterium]
MAIGMLALAAACVPRTPLPWPITLADGAAARYAVVGDSITQQGVERPDGWVNQYLGTHRVDNLGRDGWTASQVLTALYEDATFVDGVRNATLVTLDVGINDYLQARGLYIAGACGGGDGRDCLRAMLVRFGTVFDAILARVDSLAPCARVVVGDLYSLRYLDAPGSPVGDYLRLMNDHVDASGVAVAQIHAAFGDGAGLILPDGVHPNEAGQNVIAQAFAAARPVSRCHAAG